MPRGVFSFFRSGVVVGVIRPGKDGLGTQHWGELEMGTVRSRRAQTGHVGRRGGKWLGRRCCFELLSSPPFHTPRRPPEAKTPGGANSKNFYPLVEMRSVSFAFVGAAQRGDGNRMVGAVNRHRFERRLSSHASATERGEARAGRRFTVAVGWCGRRHNSDSLVSTIVRSEAMRKRSCGGPLSRQARGRSLPSPASDTPLPSKNK